MALVGEAWRMKKWTLTERPNYRTIDSSGRWSACYIDLRRTKQSTARSGEERRDEESGTAADGPAHDGRTCGIPGDQDGRSLGNAVSLRTEGAPRQIQKDDRCIARQARTTSSSSDERGFNPYSLTSSSRSVRSSRRRSLSRASLLWRWRFRIASVSIGRLRDTSSRMTSAISSWRFSPPGVSIRSKHAKRLVGRVECPIIDTVKRANMPMLMTVRGVQ